MFAGAQLRQGSRPPRSQRPEQNAGFTRMEVQRLMMEEERRKYDEEFQNVVRAYGWSLVNASSELADAANITVDRPKPNNSSQSQDTLRATVARIDEMTLQSSWERASGNAGIAAMIYHQNRANALRLILQQQGFNISTTGQQVGGQPHEVIGSNIQDALLAQNDNENPLQSLLDGRRPSAYG